MQITVRQRTPPVAAPAPAPKKDKGPAGCDVTRQVEGKTVLLGRVTLIKGYPAAVLRAGVWSDLGGNKTFLEAFSVVTTAYDKGKK